MKFFLFLSSFLIFKSFSGTGVGSPSFIQELDEFDYQMSFPAIWRVSNQAASGTDGLFRQWVASNNPIVGDTDETVIKIDFLADFPASSISDLYEELKQRHSGFSFSSSSNVFISGWTSALVQNGNIFENWEYYFIGPKQVVRIQTLRKEEGFGVAHAGIILRSIRKISDGIKIKSVDFTNETGALNAISAGDKVCYKFEFEYPKELQTETMITQFRLKYEESQQDNPIKRSVIKDRSFDETTGVHSICYTILNGMQARDHLVTDMEYEVDGGSFSSGNCYHRRNLFQCDPNNKQKFPLTESLIKNPGGDSQGPTLQSLNYDKANKTLNVKVSDSSAIKMIQIYGMTQDNDEQTRFGIIFADQISNGEATFKFKFPFLAGTIINAIYFTDNSDNTSALIRGNDADLRYSFKQIGISPVKTNHSIIGL